MARLVPGMPGTNRANTKPLPAFLLCADERIPAIDTRQGGKRGPAAFHGIGYIDIVPEFQKCHLPSGTAVRRVLPGNAGHAAAMPQ